MAAPGRRAAHPPGHRGAQRACGAEGAGGRLMRILLRVDASPETGVGHLVRTMAVAEEARGRGHEVVVCGALDVEWADQQVQDAGLAVVPPPSPATAAGLAELAEREGCQVVHVDCYDVGADGNDLREVLHAKEIQLTNMEDG